MSLGCIDPKNPGNFWIFIVKFYKDNPPPLAPPLLLLLPIKIIYTYILDYQCNEDKRGNKPTHNLVYRSPSHILEQQFIYLNLDIFFFVNRYTYRESFFFSQTSLLQLFYLLGVLVYYSFYWQKKSSFLHGIHGICTHIHWVKNCFFGKGMLFNQFGFLVEYINF